LRGAAEASTKIVTVGVVAAQLESERNKTQTKPEMRDTFIMAPDYGGLDCGCLERRIEFSRFAEF
jgi:hypothetical protein